VLLFFLCAKQLKGGKENLEFIEEANIKEKKEAELES
jgi:hypothetical protein